jgi:hypothetical protein
MSDLTEQLRDNAREWDISECPQRAEIARRAADRIDWLEDVTSEQVMLIESQERRIAELKAENERYRKALGIIAIDPGNASPWHVAAQALDGTP